MNNRNMSNIKIKKMKDFKFKPYDKVLVRDSESEKWTCDLFSDYAPVEHPAFCYRCIGSCFAYCIPYEGNEHLLGTTDPYEEPFQPKDGDFVVSGWKDNDKRYSKWIAIVKGDNFEISSYETYYGYFFDDDSKDQFFPEECVECTSQEYTRAATDEEKQIFLDKLHEAGKDWDAEKKEIVDYKWKPIENRIYYYVNSVFMADAETWTGNLLDEQRYKKGNCFRTEEECQAMCDKLNEAIKNVK